MNNPFTGTKCSLRQEVRQLTYRRETYQYIAQSWVDEATGEAFTTTEQDQASIMQVYNQYRTKYGIPFADEIKSVRERYGLSAAKMAVILGIGDNQYRLYENGEVPNLSNGRMISSIFNPKVMLQFVESAKPQLSEREYLKAKERLEQIIANSYDYKIQQYEISRILPTERSERNGYAPISADRLQNLLILILNQCRDVWCTKMNKLLFYIDFLSYRDRGMAISGLTYRALPFGPVPEHWERVYGYFDPIRQEPRCVGEVEGSVLHTDQEADRTLFSPEELEIVSRVCSRFGQCTSRQLSEVSHSEPAWLQHQEGQRSIPFDSAFSLRTFVD